MYKYNGMLHYCKIVEKNGFGRVQLKLFKPNTCNDVLNILIISTFYMSLSPQSLGTPDESPQLP